VGGAAAVCAHEQARPDRLLRQLGERALEQLDVVGGGVEAGVARPQDAGQRLARLRLVAK